MPKPSPHSLDEPLQDRRPCNHETLIASRDRPRVSYLGRFAAQLGPTAPSPEACSFHFVSIPLIVTFIPLSFDQEVLAPFARARERRRRRFFLFFGSDSKGTMTGRAFITAVGAFLPGEPVNNTDLEPVLGLVNGKPSRAGGTVLRSNGIKTRHYAINRETGAPSHSGAAIAAEAVRQLASDHFSLSDIDCLACGTSLPDQIFPNHGSMVHGELKLPPCEVMASSGVCLSGVAAMKYAMMGVKSGEFQHAVASGSERASGALRGQFFLNDTDAAPSDVVKRPSLAFEKDFLRFMLSDGAGARTH